jgi:hypothetical protein
MAARRLVAVAASPSKSGISYQRLLCGSVSALSSRLQARSRVVALDITPTHVNIAVSDRDRRRAAPFGVLARSGDMFNDARSIARAFSHANRLEPSGSLNVGALVVGVHPTAHREYAPFDYVGGLLAHGADDPEVNPPFPEVEAVLFYSEAAALERAVSSADDIVRALSLLEDNLESRKFNRYATAMHPRPSAETLSAGVENRALISASEILQVVLDEMADRTPIVVDGTE